MGPLASDRDASLRIVAEAAAHTLGVERASVWLFGEGGGCIDCVELFESTPGRHSAGARLLARDFPRYFDALEQARTIAANDACADPRTCEFKESYLDVLDIGAMLDAPVRLEGKLAGVVCHEHVGGPRPWTVDEQQFAASIAAYVELALETNRRVCVERLLAEANRKSAERDKADLLDVANRELAGLVESVAHDLRAPIRRVAQLCEELAEDHAENLDPDGRRILVTALAESRRTHALLRDLHELSRAAGAPLRLADVDVTALAREVEAELRAAQPDRDVDVIVDLGLRANADLALLRTVLLHLMGNAWKFTVGVPHPRIEVGSRLDEHGAPAFHVRDNGVGFDSDHAAQIFSPFHRLHQGYGGNGIGLAIVQRIVHRHGGHVCADAQPGRGATIFFTLPAPSTSSDAAPERARIPARSA